ncbi:MAG: Fe-S-containing protein [Desulforhopalus sp.]
MSIKTFFVLVLVGLIVSFFGASNSYSLDLFSRYKAIKPVGGEVHIDISKVQDGKAHYYSYKDRGKVIKFFVVKSNDGTIRAAFDACDVCFPAKKGYDQEGDFMVCNNCGRKFHSSRINIVEGGCNPAPLKRKRVGDQLVIAVSDIIPGGRFF